MRPAFSGPQLIYYLFFDNSAHFNRRPPRSVGNWLSFPFSGIEYKNSLPGIPFQRLTRLAVDDMMIKVLNMRLWWNWQTRWF